MPMTVRAMANATGLTERQVARYKARGMPLTTATAARAWMAENTRARTSDRTPPPDAGADATEVKASGYMEARVARERAEAELAQIKALEARGALVSGEKVRSELARRLSGLREALLQIPSRLEAVLASETDPTKVHELLEDELFQALAAASEAD